ncbi:MAG: Helix-turn-helix domain protein [Candidatus Amesbacteria bacterium GW2011_GWA2_47_70]|uniref:Helix-turn-helix domain protein n=1 Tax=Candidatus Amesbacteria bacterium GW2011_GWC2_45_19 TaxID=1618366 RepID=A0A0G1M3P4_9BACT|nr:MAG: Helix-turn-helix domain protein [Candidatus Amesbacteria bacterium GW2011_GWC2_45_19]KKU37259.1 MAG: Helix-turn-helix domain protein [Candidatus Amesbacteria bacterium GW2011_GWA1_46_35]KKU68227.1 MAG: Helix-turn-helix domain protein [Microgenomates group bacterium GW2011_GWC1_47_20]KKU78926.1 MAG: Helix-turn-helix domain protein [Candidatus Amesbacteria bacterium GW2011_GWA2_47_70]
MATTWDKYKKRWEKDPEFRKAWEKTRLEYEVARALIKARIEKKMTQAQLARKMRTKQSVISRVENAQTKPTLSFLQRLADAMGGKLKVSLEI